MFGAGRLAMSVPLLVMVLLESFNPFVARPHYQQQDGQTGR